MTHGLANKGCAVPGQARCIELLCNWSGIDDPETGPPASLPASVIWRAEKRVMIRYALANRSRNAGSLNGAHHRTGRNCQKQVFGTVWQQCRKNWHGHFVITTI